MPTLKKLSTAVLGTLLLLCLCLLGCQSQLIYHPRTYTPAEQSRAHAQPLHYQSLDTTQTAWLCPRQPAVQPERIWLVFAGNGSTAIQFASYFPADLLSTDLFVLVDYPSYGSCHGSPSPASIRASIQALVPALSTQLGIPPAQLRPKLRGFGHSLGAAAALIAVQEHGISGAVLIAPFSTMKAMAQKVIGWPLCELLHHRFDNHASLQAAASWAPQIRIIHGTADEVIPPSQGQSLATAFAPAVQFFPATGAGHNDILSSHQQQIFSHMRSIR
jgi:uncharacterized protein